MTDEELLKLVPPFDPGRSEKIRQYQWWSWHPRYPYWSKSCWDAITEEEAWKLLNEHQVDRVYHNKLMKEENGQYTEIADVPCSQYHYWNSCLNVDKNYDKLLQDKENKLNEKYSNS